MTVSVFPVGDVISPVTFNLYVPEDTVHVLRSSVSPVAPAADQCLYDVQTFPFFTSRSRVMSMV